VSKINQRLSECHKYIRANLFKVSSQSTWALKALVKTFLNKVKELQSHIANIVEQRKRKRLERSSSMKALEIQLEKHTQMLTLLHERMAKAESQLFRNAPANQYHSIFEQWKSGVQS
jgi:DNA polymerase elongation subunit (family B)